MQEHHSGFTTGTAEQLLAALQLQRFSGTLALHASPGWLLAFIVSGEAEQLVRFGKYPGIETAGQYFVQFAHEVGRTPELPAVANWPVFPATAAWPTALVPLPVALRNLAKFSGLLVLNDKHYSSALLAEGQVLLARNAAGSEHPRQFSARYQQAQLVHFVPLPNEVHKALQTTEPPSEFTRGASTVLTLQGMQQVAPPTPVPVVAPPEPTAPPAQTSVPPVAPEPPSGQGTTGAYRATLRGRDALDPMSDRAGEFRATFDSAAAEVLRAIVRGRSVVASNEVLEALEQGGYIYVPENA